MPSGVLHESGLVTERVPAVFASAVEVGLVFPGEKQKIKKIVYFYTC